MKLLSIILFFCFFRVCLYWYAKGIERNTEKVIQKEHDIDIANDSLLVIYNERIAFFDKKIKEFNIHINDYNSRVNNLNKEISRITTRAARIQEKLNMSSKQTDTYNPNNNIWPDTGYAYLPLLESNLRCLSTSEIAKLTPVDWELVYNCDLETIQFYSEECKCWKSPIPASEIN